MDKGQQFTTYIVPRKHVENMTSGDESIYGWLNDGDAPKIRDLTTSDIYESNPFDYDYDWEGMHDSIAQHGVKEPLTVSKDGKTLLDGHHRATISRDAGTKYLPVKRA